MESKELGNSIMEENNMIKIENGQTIVTHTGTITHSDTGIEEPFKKQFVFDKIKEIGLGEVMNQVFTKDDDRHNRGGGIQLLTNNIVSRIDITETAFVMALTKYLNKDSWNK